jgi:hypothetical protein
LNSRGRIPWQGRTAALPGAIPQGAEKRCHQRGRFTTFLFRVHKILVLRARTEVLLHQIPNERGTIVPLARTSSWMRIKAFQYYNLEDRGSTIGELDYESYD